MALKFFLILSVLAFYAINEASSSSSSKIYCYQCSGETPACSQNPTSLKSKKCYKPDKCYTLKTGDQRGCATENSFPCQEPGNCEFCDSEDCNKQILPANRLSCYHCSGDDCSKLVDKFILPCERHYEDNKCFTLKDPETKKIIQRGCIQKTAVYHDCMMNGPSVCKLCDGKACNVHSDWDDTETTTVTPGPTKTTAGPGEKFTCFQCRSDMDANCASDNLGHMQPEVCRESVNDDNKGCYKDLHDDGVVYRGCVADIVNHDILRRCRDKNYKNCEICDEKNCNGGKAPRSSAFTNTGISFAILTLISFVCLLF